MSEQVVVKLNDFEQRLPLVVAQVLSAVFVLMRQ